MCLVDWIELLVVLCRINSRLDVWRAYMGYRVVQGRQAIPEPHRGYTFSKAIPPSPSISHDSYTRNKVLSPSAAVCVLYSSLFCQIKKGIWFISCRVVSADEKNTPEPVLIFFHSSQSLNAYTHIAIISINPFVLCLLWTSGWWYYYYIPTQKRREVSLVYRVYALKHSIELDWHMNWKKLHGWTQLSTCTGTTYRYILPTVLWYAQL